MKRYIRSSETPVSVANRIAQAKRELTKFPQECVDYVRECQDEIAKVISDYYTEEEERPVGPEISQIKKDYMLGAIEDDMMTEEDFDEIFDLLDIINIEYAHRFA